MAMGTLQDFTIDQMAGSAALVIGSIGALLTIIWQSRCHCKCNLCYLFQCERRPPPDDVERPADDAAAVEPEPEPEPETLIPPKSALRPEPEPEMQP